MSGFASAPVEWTWFVISIIATGFTAYGLREAIMDHAFLISSGMNGIRKAVAEMNQRGEGFRVIKCVVMVLASGASLFLPPPPPDYTELPQSLVSMIAWILVALVMLLHSYLDRKTRQKIAHVSADAHPIDPVTGRKIAQKGNVDGADGGAGSATFEPTGDNDRRQYQSGSITNDRRSTGITSTTTAGESHDEPKTPTSTIITTDPD
jgi:hypothetical protein